MKKRLKEEIRFCAIYPNITDPTSFYRGAGVIPYVETDLPMEILTPPQFSWPNAVHADVVFLQRGYEKNHVTVAELAKRCKAKLWVDYDDDLIAIGTENQTHAVYGTQETMLNIVRIVQMADVVSVSTQNLANSLTKQVGSEIEEKLLVIPNAWNDHLFGPIDKNARLQRTKEVMWRGSATHCDDLIRVAKDIVDVATAHTDWGFRFIGFNPWFITQAIPNALFEPSRDVVLYMETLRNRMSSLAICPIRNTTFNQSKSNIAWIEGVAAGATVIAPSLPEWVKPGIINYYPSPKIVDSREASETRTDLWPTLTAALITSEDELHDLWSQSVDYINKNLLLSGVNYLRRHILRELNKPS